jgi:glycine oxidase
MAERSDEIAIVGAGLIGTGIAYELAKRGASVVVFDRAEPGRAASWAGAGMLAPFSEELPDAALLELGRASLAMYPAFVDDLRARTGLDARLLPYGTLHLALDAAGLHELHAQADVYARNGGDVSLLDRRQTIGREAAVARTVAGSLFIANEAQIDNRRLGRALVAGCAALGVRFVRSAGLALEADARRVRGLRGEHGFVPARTVINAAGAWAGTLAGVPEAARVPVYPVAGEMLAIAVPHGFARSLIWHRHTYLVPRDDGRLLVGATVVERGFDTRVTAAGMSTLLNAALVAAPALGNFAVVETWAGLRPGSQDKRPYLGPTPLEGYFVAAGHHRNGILLTPITARAIADLVLTGATEISLTAFAATRHAPECPAATANTATS